MALVKKSISKSLQTFLLSLQDNPTTIDKIKIQKYADGFSDWLIESVKTATITVPPGITLATTAPATGATNVSAIATIE